MQKWNGRAASRAASEAACAAGDDRAEVNGLMVEVPTYRVAQRLLRRAAGPDRPAKDQSALSDVSGEIRTGSDL
jgi:hypothetical protein